MSAPSSAVRSEVLALAIRMPHDMAYDEIFASTGRERSLLKRRLLRSCSVFNKASLDTQCVLALIVSRLDRRNRAVECKRNWLLHQANHECTAPDKQVKRRQAG